MAAKNSHRVVLARAAAWAMFYRELGRALHSLDRPSTLRRDQLDCPEVTGQFGSVDRGGIRAGLGSGHVFVGHVEVACVAPRRSPRVANDDLAFGIGVPDGHTGVTTAGGLAGLGHR